MDNQNNKNNNNPKNNKQGWGVILVTTLLTVFIVMGLYSMMQDKNPAELSYDEFLTKVDDGEIEKVTIDSSKLYVTLTDEARKNEKSDKKTAGGDTPKDASDLINQLEQKKRRRGAGTGLLCCPYS